MQSGSPHHRATNPEVYFVAYHDYAGVVAIFADENSGTVGTCVVDGDDEEDFWTNSRNDFKYMLLRFVTWQNNGDFFGSPNGDPPTTSGRIVGG